jgi:hypothetical protein
VLGRLLHDHTADDIARATSRLPRVVTTAVPFDVAGLIERRATADAAARAAAARRSTANQTAVEQVHDHALDSTSPSKPNDAEPVPHPDHTGSSIHPASGREPQHEPGQPLEPLAPDARSRGVLVASGSRRAPDTTPIGDLVWRRRAAIEGQVRSVRMAPMAGSPSVEIDLWDDTGGVTLVFFGRRSITGVAPGCRMAAEGMVAERHGRFAIANPLYRLLDSTDPLTP